jgi:enoyl-CoA hydratase/carnithine racemase
MDFENIVLEKSHRIATVVLDRPPGNTLSLTVLENLTAVFGEINDDREVRAVILTGAGDRFFCAGADIRELRSVDPVELAERGQVLFRSIETLSKPVIAAVNGAAYGGGCELAMACHLRVAADSARFAQQEANYGLMPSWGATQRLPRLIGRARALELLLTGDVLDAPRAELYGLVNARAPAAELVEAARQLARRLAAAPPLVVKAILSCVDTGLQQGLQEGLDSERENFGWIYRTEDARVGLHAFFAKVRPEFKGR